MFQLTAGAEPIAGYQLLSHLGAGGYGEVWKVTAPGDLTKAMKFVYGRMDDVRAARELKALSRIKQVRHPFLLSLERFEIINGQLVIVTELADMSLLERYEQCRQSGLAGIPREELLTHLRDAADALDYMSENHGLQHLDIKPENLLLVGGRVKVADFGLVKDLHEGMATLIGGVTPVYAAPEAFDGRASRFSDQYSLAVTYQEMLTGVRPFPGATAAQLAIQHMNSPPLLGPLPVGDRAAMARALAKDPEQRFASCREMVECLQQADRPPSPVELTTRTPVVAREDDTFHTTAITMAASKPAAETIGPRPIADTRPSSRPIAATRPDKTLPPLAFSSQAGLRPTVFLGVGGTGASTLRRLRQRLVDRFGDLSAVPALQLLLLDTDPRESYRSGGEGIPALEPGEVLSLPLRRSQDYRKECDQILGWLSRRWLYNIPRSQLTEGLRPLGRLALIDHIRRVFERLTQAISQAAADEAIAKTASAMGLKFRSTAPRVWIVASISGGTGGGMLIDLAYMARQILGELRLPDEGVAALLTHATNRNIAAKDLARSNAYATLSELAHFTHPEVAYPGDHVCGLRQFAPEVPPFQDQYLVHLGDDLNETEFHAACDSVAEYLSLDAATCCGSFFDKCRQERPAGTSGAAAAEATLRTFGMHRIHIPKQSAVSAAADLICKRTVDRWRGESLQGRSASGPSAARSKEAAHRQRSHLLEPGEVDRLAAEFADTLELSASADKLATRLLAAVESKLGKPPDELFAQLIAKLTDHSHAENPHQRASQAIQLIDTMLGCAEDPENSAGSPQPLQAAFEQVVDQSAAELEHAIAQWLLQLVESPRGRLRAAVRGAEWFCQQLLSLQQATSASLEHVQQQRVALAQHLCMPASPAAKGRRGHRGGAPPDDARLIEYGRLRFQEITLARAGDVLATTHGQLVWLADQFVQGRRRLADFEKKWQPSMDAMQNLAGRSPPAANVTTVWYGQSANFAEAVVAIVDGLGPDFLLEFDCEIQRDVLAPQGGLHSAALNSNDPDSTLWSELRAAARAAVLRALKDIDAARLLIDSSTGPQPAAESLAPLLQTAAPRLRGVGGLKRTLILIPDGPSGKSLHEHLPLELTKTVTTLFDPYEDIVLLQESQQLPLAEVADMLIGQRRDYADIAQRTMTRVDIYWTPLHQHLNEGALVHSQ